MGLKLEVGKFYKTRDGRKVGQMATWDCGATPATRLFDAENMHGQYWSENGDNCDGDGGQVPGNRELDLISEWTEAPTGPVRTVTRKEIVPGEYNGLDVGRAVNGTVFLAMPIANHCQESIDALIANLTAIRDALETTDAV